PDQDQTLGFETERSIPRPLLFCGKPGSAGRTTPNHALPSGAVEQLVRFDGFGLIGTVKGKNSPQWLGVHRGPARHRARPRARRVSRPSRKSSANVSPTQAGTDAGLATVITVPSMVISANTIIHPSMWPSTASRLFCISKLSTTSRSFWSWKFLVWEFK